MEVIAKGKQRTMAKPKKMSFYIGLMNHFKWTIILPIVAGIIMYHQIGNLGLLFTIPSYFVVRFIWNRLQHGGLKPGMKAIDGKVEVVGHSKFDHRSTNLLSF